jgi:hypothetical protein
MILLFSLLPVTVHKIVKEPSNFELQRLLSKFVDAAWALFAYHVVASQPAG